MLIIFSKHVYLLCCSSIHPVQTSSPHQLQLKFTAARLSTLGVGKGKDLKKQFQSVSQNPALFNIFRHFLLNYLGLKLEVAQMIDSILKIQTSLRTAHAIGNI